MTEVGPRFEMKRESSRKKMGVFGGGSYNVPLSSKGAWQKRFGTLWPIAALLQIRLCILNNGCKLDEPDNQSTRWLCSVVRGPLLEGNGHFRAFYCQISRFSAHFFLDRVYNINWCVSAQCTWSSWAPWTMSALRTWSGGTTRSHTRPRRGGFSVCSRRWWRREDAFWCDVEFMSWWCPGFLSFANQI